MAAIQNALKMVQPDDIISSTPGGSGGSGSSKARGQMGDCWIESAGEKSAPFGALIDAIVINDNEMKSKCLISIKNRV